MTTPLPLPFRLRIEDSVWTDLRARLRRTRWPDEPSLPAWTTGSSLGYMQSLVEFWAEDFEWRRQEEALNRMQQFKVELGGIDLHYIHQPGVGPNPMPLLLSHGWPGSVFEFIKIIPMLTDPARFGGDPADAFTVIAPSLPGYGLSFRPGQRRFAVEEIADLFAELMVSVLGFKRFAAQGGDWGSLITTIIGARYPEHLFGVHLNMLPLRRDAQARAKPNEEEQHFAQMSSSWMREHSAYQAIQGTRPQTLAFALNDSPVGLAAWMVEKFRAWSDCDDDPEGALSRDEMLAHISLYWATGAIGSSFWPYYARMHRPWPIPEGTTVNVPTGVALFPRELLQPPRSLAERLFKDIRRWTRMAHGGHFAAQEQPQALASEIREFFRPLRDALA